MGARSFASVVSDTKALYIEFNVTTTGNIEAGIDNIRATESVPKPTTMLGFLVADGIGTAIKKKLASSHFFLALLI